MTDTNPKSDDVIEVDLGLVGNIEVHKTKDTDRLIGDEEASGSSRGGFGYLI